MKFKSIKYKGKKWANYKDLVAYSNQLKNSNEQITEEQFDVKWRRWQAKNIGKLPTFELIERWLTSRAAANSISYKGTRYKGPSALYEVNKNIANISFKAFHLNLKKNVTDIDDDFITACLQGTRVVSREGTRISQFRSLWEKIESPKVSWARVSQQITAYRKEFGCEPSEQCVKKMCAKDSVQWLDKRSSRFGLGHKDFFNSIIDIKFKRSFKSWLSKIRQNYKVTGKVIRESLAIELAKSDPHPDCIVGILYEVINLINNKKYIGITTQSLDERKRAHIKDSKSQRNSARSLQQAIKKHGKDNFIFTEVGKFNSIEDLENAEIELIKNENSLSPNGYNLDKGGKGVRGWGRLVVYRGVSYKNLTTLCHVLHLNLKRIESRLRLGFSLEEAIEMPKGMVLKTYQNGHKIPLKIKAMIAGIPYKKVHERQNAGWTENEALEKEPRRYRSANAKPITVSGIAFNSIRAAALFYKIPEGRVRKRLKLKWPIERVFK